MKQELSLGQKFFAPTPYRTLLGMLCFLVFGIICLFLYLGEAGIIFKYIALACLLIIFVLQFQVDWLGYALDEFEPLGDDFDKPNEATFFNDLDLDTATLQQLYDAHYYWWDLWRNTPIHSSESEIRRNKVIDLKNKIDGYKRIMATQKEVVQVENATNNAYVYDDKSGLHLYKSNRDPKTGRFIKNEKTT